MGKISLSRAALEPTMPSPVLTPEMKARKAQRDRERHARNRATGRPVYTDPELQRQQKARRDQIRSQWRAVHRAYLALLRSRGLL